LQRALDGHLPLAMAGPARFGDDTAGTPTMAAGACDTEKPCWKVTCPRPWQVGQLVGLVPGAAPLPEQVPQRSLLGIRICVSVPKAASSKEISRL